MFGGLRSRLLLVSEPHRRLFRNRSFVLLWSGQSASVFGDAFFNLAVMWVVWSETQSTLMTAIVQAIWHIPDVLFAPLAGVLADRWDRKAIMVSTNIAAAAVVGAVAVVIVVVGHLPPVVAFVAVFKLNSLTTFLNPARASVMPSVVGRDLLTTAQGLFSTARETASLVGSAAAGTADYGWRAQRGPWRSTPPRSCSFRYASRSRGCRAGPPLPLVNRAPGFPRCPLPGTCATGGGQPRGCR